MKKLVLLLAIALLTASLSALAEDMPVIVWSTRVPEAKATPTPVPKMDDETAFQTAMEKLRQNNR